MKKPGFVKAIELPVIAEGDVRSQLENFLPVFIADSAQRKGLD